VIGGVDANQNTVLGAFLAYFGHVFGGALCEAWLKRQQQYRYCHDP